MQIGIEFAFLSGVYSPSIGFTREFEDSKRLVGLSGIFIGAGEITGFYKNNVSLCLEAKCLLRERIVLSSGGALFGILGSKTNRHGRDPVIMLGFLTQAIGFFLIFLNIPDTAPFGDTNDVAYISSRYIV